MALTHSGTNDKEVINISFYEEYLNVHKKKNLKKPQSIDYKLCFDFQVALTSYIDHCSFKKRVEKLY